MNAYQVKDWSFPAGSAFSVVCAVLAQITNIASWILSIAEVVGGIIIGALYAEEWYRDYYWKYMINQVYPTIDRFTAYSAEYLYQREKRYTLNDGNTDWEQIYYSDYYGSSSFWEELVNNIGYYFIF